MKEIIRTTEKIIFNERVKDEKDIKRVMRILRKFLRKRPRTIVEIIVRVR